MKKRALAAVVGVTAIIVLAFIIPSQIGKWGEETRCKAKAQVLLTELRKGTEIYDRLIRELRSDVTKAGLTLTEIGTSEEELKKLRIKASAMRNLRYLRKNSDSFRLFLCDFRKYVAKGGFSLSEIGTSEAELEELRIKGHKASAIKTLDYLRKGSITPSFDLRELVRDIVEGGLTLSDIGTSKEELEILANRIISSKKKKDMII
ncbi:MAG: hypothetical protein V1690_02190 [Candidatus Moraniibacteriota bacterium]